jgi:hypothetical protein
MASKNRNKFREIIKQSNLVLGINEKSSGTEVVLKRFKDDQAARPTYLSDVFSATPFGFLYKDETGMGATTLELNADRHSLIVEPIKITASSKAHQHPGALYVGGYTRYHPKKSTTEEEITEYLLDENIFPKKIIAVADSLPKVLNVFGDPAYNIFFFLIDEIDSFQLDSTFRKSMEYALSVYKKFPAESRAMLSATRIQFSDPVLKREPITFVKYDTPSVRKINVLTCPTGNVKSLAAETIGELLQNHKNEKFLVAFNSVSGCYDLAEHLTKKGLILEEEVTILCSKSSQERVNKYYRELDSEQLPTNLTFITSAFFTGFDLYDQYHLISLSSSLSKVFSLSERRLKQIAGRCRNTLLSETVIHDIVTDTEKFELDETKLLHEAGLQLAAMECMMFQYSSSIMIGQHLSSISQSILKTFEEKNIGFIYLGEDDLYHISYLFIDAQLEIQRVRESLYKTPEALTNRLREDGNKVFQHIIASNTTVATQNILQGARDKEIQDLMVILEDATDSQLLKYEIEQGYMSGFQKSICEAYLDVVDYVDTAVAIELISESLVGKRDMRAFNNLMAKISFLILPKGYLPVDRIDAHFPVGSVFSREEVLYRMNIFLGEMNLGQELKKTDDAIRKLKNYRKISKISLGNGIVNIKILSKPTIPNVVTRKKKSIYNPEDLKFFTRYYANQ